MLPVPHPSIVPVKTSVLFAYNDAPGSNFRPTDRRIRRAADGHVCADSGGLFLGPAGVGSGAGVDECDECTHKGGRVEISSNGELLVVAAADRYEHLGALRRVVGAACGKEIGNRCPQGGELLLDDQRQWW